jgi:hypothetical protein
MGRLFSVMRPAVAVAALGLSVSAGSLQAQTLKGTILGTITDTSGAVIPRAQVVIIETGTNTRRSVVTNESGFYAAANLDPGMYRVEAEHTGFRKIVRPGIDLSPNNTARVDLELSPGAVSEVVEVAATAPLLQTDRSDTGGQLQTTELQNMPLGYNRNYQGLLMTVPGISRSFRTRSEFFNSQDSLSNRVNGQSQLDNNVQIEGIDNNLEFGDLTGIVPPIEAIQTVDISTTNYDPELGRAGGAVTNLTIRSGTNQFHGTLFYFHKNENMQALDVFATVKAPTVYNQFGGTLGGPIKKNKTFFFADYQGSRDHKGGSNQVTIPNMPFRSGDFSGSPTIIYDPATGAADGRSRTPFPQQQIPAIRISPIARRLLAFIDAPTRAGDVTNFEKATVRVKTLDQVDTKIDHSLTDKDRLMGRYSFQRAYVSDPGLYGPNNGIYGGPHAGGFEGYGPARTQSLGLNFSKVWSPTLVMEFRTGVVRNYNSALPWDYQTKAAADVGIPGANLDDWSSGLSGFNVSGYTTPMVGTRDDIPWIRANTNLGLATNWTKSAHNHVIKFGYDLKRYRRELQQSGAGPRGLFSFGNGPTSLNGGQSPSYANAFASFLLDRPNSITRDRPVLFPARRDWIHSLYVQDKWQVMPRLTLDLGLRWEYWPSSTPQFPGGFAAYNWTNNTIELAGLGSIPMNLGVQQQKKSFAPRVGLAYRFNPKTVFRGGYGISYQPRSISNFGFPVKQANSYPAENSFGAAGSMAAGVPAPDQISFPSNGIISPAPPTVSASVTKKDEPHSYVQAWNIALQRALPANFTLEAAYVGTHTINEQIAWNYNVSPRLGCAAACQPFNIKYGRTAGVNIGIGGHIYYNALQAKFNRRFSNGFMLTTAYTYSKSLDLAIRSAQTTPGGDALSRFLDKGRTDNDITHVFTQSYIYELPFGRSKLGAKSGVVRVLLGGWQLNGLLLLQTGTPLNIGYSSTTLNTSGHNNQPNLIGAGTPAIFGNVGPGQLWFDTSRFAPPPPLTFGNVGRNILNGPGVVNLDASVFRKFRVKEGISLEFRVEGFNVSNTPHFANPNTTVGNPGFGQVTTSNDFTDSTNDTDNRKLQVGLRLFF